MIITFRNLFVIAIACEYRIPTNELGHTISKILQF